MNLTILIMLITAVFLIVVDIWLIRTRGKQESISAHVIRGSRKMPLLVLAFGILLGHLFWSMKTEDIYYNTKCITEEK